MMPPYGAPYAAIYPHGGVYAHAAVPLVSEHSFCFFLGAYVLDSNYGFSLPLLLGE